MKNVIKLTIGNPCSENFNNFNQTPRGGFCTSCTKNVIDFSKMNDEQVVNYFKNNTEKTCGYFKRSQLNRTVKVENFSKPNRKAVIKYAALALLSFASLHHIQAQDHVVKTEVIQNPKQVTENKHHKGVSQEVLITGKILEAPNALPLPEANIVLKGTNIGVASDFDGEFKFPKPLSVGDVLVISYLGFTTQEITIKRNQTELNAMLKIKMEADVSCVLMGEVAVNDVYSSKPSFWQRIKNIF